jgi:heme A synthase
MEDDSMAQGNAGPGVRGSAARKLALLGLTLVPLVLYAALLVWIVQSFFVAPTSSDNTGDPFGARLVLSMLLVSALGFGMIIWYLRDAMRNTALDTAGKVIWALVFLQLGTVAMPVYWFLYIWREATSRASAGAIARDMSPLESA